MMIILSLTFILDISTFYSHCFYAMVSCVRTVCKSLLFMRCACRRFYHGSDGKRKKTKRRTIRYVVALPWVSSEQI